MKDGIRKTLLKKRKELPEEEYDKKSIIILENIRNILNNFNYNNIAMYYPFRKEVNILPLLEIIDEKNIFFPKIVGNEMTFVKISSMNDFEKGKFGIMEPIGNYYSDNIDVFLIPGVAFDIKFYRLGYGGGYYDRYFSNHKRGFLIGIAFDFQVVKELPSFEHDIKMDMIITENRILKGE
jgi:5-formyltetrahydrofolate cyclo-ligase